MNPEAWVRAHIRSLVPYSSARSVYGSGDRIYLDANESPYESVTADLAPGLNRYPDPACSTLRRALADWLQVEPERLWIGNGSDEALDLLLRTFVEPGERVVICTPTYSMYGISARAHAATVQEVPLDERFDLDAGAVLAGAVGAKLVFLCSPNNPTGNRMSRERVLRLVAEFPGLVVVDEAYVEFSATPSLVELVSEHRNLAVLRTFSKAWGLAGARIGYLVADPVVVDYLDRVNLPYPLSALAAAAAERALREVARLQERVATLVAERGRLVGRLNALGFSVFPSDANFVLVRIPNAQRVYRRLAEEFRIVVRDRSAVPRLENCLRISVGRPEETDRLCAALEEMGR